jgi:hypothetical protein
MPSKKIPVKKRPLAKRVRRFPRKGAAVKGQRKALDALFKTYPINGNDDDS